MSLRLITKLAGVLLLGALSFTACQPASSGENNNNTNGVSGSATNGGIVFVRQDSIIERYDALGEKLDGLEGKYSVLEQDQQGRISAFQRDVQRLQQRANSGQMAPKTLQTEQERLAIREQQLMQDAERVRQEFQLEQLAIMQVFQDNVKKVLEEVQAEFGYDYILNYGAGSSVLMVNDTNDITDVVAERLNKLSMDPPAEGEEGADATEGEEAAEGN